jgi:hypothetical protein
MARLLPDKSDKSTAAIRLKRALATLTQRKSSLGKPQYATAAELCRLAGVSRNSLYRYHGGTLGVLRKLQSERPPELAPSGTRPIEQLRTENTALRQQMAEFAGLIDHYYAAYREAVAMLGRRDRELAAVRRRLDIKPVLIKS